MLSVLSAECMSDWVYERRESRYFKTWKKLRSVEDHMVMTAIADLTGQRTVPFGDGALIFRLVPCCVHKLAKCRVVVQQRVDWYAANMWIGKQKSVGML